MTAEHATDTFTALGDPSIEEVIASHMQRIVEAIRAGMEPDAILLRGSFGRGEGNVIMEDGRLKFLSDYEINVETSSYRHRPFFARVADSLSAELGVQTSIVWMRPDYFQKLRVGPFAAGPVPVTISLYETRYASRVLYGEDLLQAAPEIDASLICMSSGLQLMLNRMAESLTYLPGPDGTTENEWQSIHWLNKLVLACLEAILVSWGQYHYSYRERGRRFSQLANGRLGFMENDAQTLYRLAERATEFRLRPERGLYPNSLQGTSEQVVSICERVFLHLASREWGPGIGTSYTLYPEQYRQAQLNHLASFTSQRALYKLLDVYKYGRTHQLPLNLLSPNTAGEVVYSVVPLLFAGWARRGAPLCALLETARRQMSQICPLAPAAADSRDEWRQLYQQMFVLWKNFCT